MKRLKIPKYVIILFILTVANLVIVFLRNHIIGDTTFNWLLSNLWSGIVPLLIAIALQYFNPRLNKFFFVIISLLWLLFYPNAPYMISDLSHPHIEPKDTNTNSLIIYDTLMIFSLAMLSVFYGFVSLKIVFDLYRQRFGKVIAHFFVFISLCLSCLGFYMGRELLSEIKEGNNYLYSSEIFKEPLLNLFNNAFYAVKNAQPLKENDYQPMVTVSTKRINSANENAATNVSSKAASIEIVVADNGIGIPSNIIDKIFQPFFTTKPTGEGTGLGLSMNYDIIAKEHGGTIRVKSKEGEGTTFTNVLPV